MRTAAADNMTASATGAKALAFNYDSNGSTTTENLKQYIYNQNQRLIKVTESGAVKGEYVYNGSGQRVKKTTQSGTVIYHYDLQGKIMAESTSAGTIQAEYAFLNNSPLAKLEGASVYYYHNDHLGTPIMMTDANGNKVWEAEYMPFGEPVSVTGTITNNLRFPGQYYDAETGLNYNYFRDYNPMIGRYVEADPIGIENGGNHLFVYVWNSPLKWTDPKGLMRFPFTPPSGCDYYEKKCKEKKCTDQDKYACKVVKCCKAFGDNPTANCIRGCLIAFDQRNCANLTGEARNRCRRLEHWDCYDRCLGHGLGAGGLLTGPPTECLDAMDEVGGMGF